MRFALSFAVLAVLGLVPANAEEPAYDAAASEVMERMDSDDRYAAIHAMCPADLFGKDQPFWRPLVADRNVSLETCEKDAMSCFLRCSEARSGAACFGLARAFQENHEDDKSRYWQMLFAQACALGYAAGCTNRGAGIRNGYYADDPFDDVDRSSTELCLFRTFEASCGDDEAWGCSMHGQSYYYGEGVVADPEAALRACRKACDISPDFAACDFARPRIEELEGGAEGGGEL